MKIYWPWVMTMTPWIYDKYSCYTVCMRIHVWIFYSFWVNDFVLVFVNPCKSRKASSKHIAAEESKRKKRVCQKTIVSFYPHCSGTSRPSHRLPGPNWWQFCKHWRKPNAVEFFFDAHSEKNGVQSGSV